LLQQDTLVLCCVHNIIQLFVSFLTRLFAAFLLMSTPLSLLRSVSVHGLAICGPTPGL
jgi:hypothetical protein